MKCSLYVALGFVLTTPAIAAEDKKAVDLTDPVEILKRVDAAAKAVHAAKYTTTVKGVRGSKSIIPHTEGTVTLSGWATGGVEKFLVVAKVKEAGVSEARHITAGSDGDLFFVIEQEGKTAYEDIDPNVLGRNDRPVRLMLMAEFVHPTPFHDELAGNKQELTGSKVIGGEDCYEIHVVYANGVAEAIWHFSKKDFLPRARLDIFQTQAGKPGGRQRIVTNLVVDPKLQATDFKLKLPAGYKKTDDFAP